MSFNQNHMINLVNYEEYFILYMDNELTVEQKQMVENFIAQHPQLAEELDILMSTKLPLDNLSFIGKEDLHSSAMKLNTVDESLLLYIDNELPLAERKAVEQKISSSQDFALQHSLLMQTKLDANEKIIHPNKKELYRHTEKVIAFKAWMRIAAAVVLLLLGSLFFLLNKNDKPADSIAIKTGPIQSAPTTNEESTPVEKIIHKTTPSEKEESTLAKTSEPKPQKRSDVNSVKKEVKKLNEVITPEETEVVYQPERKVIKFEVERLASEVKPNDVAISKTFTHNPVTSFTPNRKTDEDTQEVADPSGDFKNSKRTSAKGFFRKVTRFIERNTGIGTANADDEVLIGAVALKLK